jgi:hypothetical protein
MASAARRSPHADGLSVSKEPLVEDIHKENLEEAVTHTTDEARMILPGVQAILGFQLIAVFNQTFEQMSDSLQLTHLAAFVLLVLAMGLLMTPAAYHRTLEPRVVTARFVFIASGLLALAMVPLAVGLALDAFVISYLITGSQAAAAGVAVALFLALVTLWFVFPRLMCSK